MPKRPVGQLQYGPPMAVLFLTGVAVLAYEVWLLTKHERWPSAYPEAVAVMRSVFYDRHGGAEVLQVGNVPQPRLSTGMIKVQVYAAALNPVDFKIRRNENFASSAPKPKIPGSDVSGVVLEASRGSGLRVGDKVFACLPIGGSRWGSLAPVVVADARLFAKAPSSISLEEAAALPLAGLTVLQTLGTLPTVKKGGAVLIQAGMGGVGSLAVQYARQVLGYEEVVATASASSEEALKALGATRVLDYRAEGLAQASDEDFKRIIGPVDAVLDPMSWLYEEKTLRSGIIKPRGTYLHVTSSDWRPNDGESSLAPIANAIKLKWKHRLTNIFDWNGIRYHSDMVTPGRADLERLAALVDAGRLRPVIERTYRLDEAGDAFRHLEGGHVKGKLVIVMDHS